MTIKIKWKVRPKGHWSHGRSWPTGWINDKPAVMIRASENYSIRLAKSGEHKPLQASIALYWHDKVTKEKNGAFTWKLLGNKFNNLELLKKAMVKFYSDNPHFMPPKQDKNAQTN